MPNPNNPDFYTNSLIHYPIDICVNNANFFINQQGGAGNSGLSSFGFGQTGMPTILRAAPTEANAHPTNPDANPNCPTPPARNSLDFLNPIYFPYLRAVNFFESQQVQENPRSSRLDLTVVPPTTRHVAPEANLAASSLNDSEATTPAYIFPNDFLANVAPQQEMEMAEPLARPAQPMSRDELNALMEEVIVKARIAKWDRINWPWLRQNIGNELILRLKSDCRGQKFVDYTNKTMFRRSKEYEKYYSIRSQLVGRLVDKAVKEKQQDKTMTVNANWIRTSLNDKDINDYLTENGLRSDLECYLIREDMRDIISKVSYGLSIRLANYPHVRLRLAQQTFLREMGQKLLNENNNDKSPGAIQKYKKYFIENAPKDIFPLIDKRTIANFYYAVRNANSNTLSRRRVH